MSDRRPWLVAAGALVAGVLVGSCLLFIWQDGAPEARGPATTGPRSTGAPLIPIAAEGPPSPSFPSKPIRPPADSVLLAWSTADLPPGTGGRIREATGAATTEVRRGPTLLSVAATTTDRRHLPLDTIGIEPASFRAFVSPTVAPTVGDLHDGVGLLSESSARVRRLGRGGMLALRPLDGEAPVVTVTIADVVPDTDLGGAELAITTATAARVGLGAVRYVLIAAGEELDAVRARVATLIPRPNRLRASGETPYLRDTDAVLPQAIVKDRFGEFSYRIDGDRVTIDPAWERQNITTDDVPLLGSVRCHRAVVPALREAMSRLEREHLGWVIDPAGFGGCFNPKLIRDRGELSRHSWGIAVDLNFPRNRTGDGSLQDPRLVQVMNDAGFVWGGGWLVPDAAYFEYVGVPQAG